MQKKKKIIKSSSVRRSSSKKGNFLPKQHSQPQLDTGIKFAYQQHHHHHHSKTKQNLVAQNLANDNIEVSDTGADIEQIDADQPNIDRKRDSLKHCCSCGSFHSSDQITPIDRCTFATTIIDADLPFLNKMQSDSVTSTSSARCIPDSDGNESNASAISSPTAIDLTIENLPAVDTPDACDKAATR